VTRSSPRQQTKTQASAPERLRVSVATVPSARRRPSLSILVDSSAAVRLHAARSLGRRGTIVAAEQVASLLRDRDWWVRTAAKLALENLGVAAAPAVAPLLQANDEFARNGAAEVLQNLGVVRTLVDRVAALTKGSRDGQAAAAELAPIFAAGGPRFALLALEHLDQDAGLRAREVMKGAS